jgi:hypothetical protein
MRNVRRTTAGCDAPLSPERVRRAFALLLNGALERIDARDLDGFERGVDELITLVAGLLREDPVSIRRARRRSAAG